MKPALSSFFSELIAVVLGIVITFAGQGMIDRAHDRKEVRSALQLVRTELISNRDDISELRTVLEQVQQSARYLADNSALLQNVHALDSSDLRTLTYHQSMVFADIYLSLPHDALELLKTSSIFQKIGDNALSMKIIRAYDCCQVMLESINRHFVAKSSQTDQDLPKWLLNHSPLPYVDPADIDTAITAINVFLRQ